MDLGSTENPHSGTDCIKAQYTATGEWGGVIWQNPDNNWGDKGGGYNITGASKLTFWARGDNEGERVSFLVGIIGDDKPFHDTAKAKLDSVQLSKDWKQYTIDLAN